jgi:cysteine desulfurase
VIYLDHHAAAPLCEAARAALLSAYAEPLGNPASVHRAGQRARRLVEEARAQLARALGAQPADLLFTGPGSEACNLGLLGRARPRLAEGARRVITTPLEHPAMAASARQLAKEGAEVIELAMEGARVPAVEALAALLDAGATAAVVVQWVNHETGTCFPVADYAALCAARGVPLVVDASQAFGKLPIDLRRLPVSALIVSASKVGGPGGVSALWNARCEPLEPVLHGGSQERGMRPGTPDVAALAGFGAAAARVPQRLAAQPAVAALRDRLEAGLVQLGGVVNGAEGERVGTVTNLSFRGLRSDVLVVALDLEGLCVSAGAACSSGLAGPSPVLRALYPHEPWRAESALRFSLGPETSAADVDGALAIAARVLGRARARASSSA